MTTATDVLEDREHPELAASDWRQYAACHGEDPELFFPLGTGPATHQQTEKAKQICNACPVRGECLRTALSVPEKHGIFGGLTSDERMTMRRRRQKRASSARARAAAREAAAARPSAEHAAVVALLERERVRDPDALEAERFAPTPAERGFWNHHMSGQDEI